MSKSTVALYALNRGEVSSLALARVDIERLRLSAETQVNWMPRILGPMSLRPGTAYVGGIKNDLAAKIIPFIFDLNNTALIEMTPNVLRVWVDDAVVSRAAVSTTVAGFGAWTATVTGTGAISQAGSIATFSGAISGSTAILSTTMTVSAGDAGVKHGLRIVVANGPVNFRVGSSLNGDEYIATTSIGTGTHSLAFTPAVGTVYVAIESTYLVSKVVTSIAVEIGGVLELPTPYASSDLSVIRYEQSADVIFLACKGKPQYKIERRGVTSWSMVKFICNDGPFAYIGDSSIILTPSALSGNATIASNKPFFKSTHIGTLLRLFHNGQSVSASLSASDTYSTAVRVTGVGAARSFPYSITGTWVGAITLQRSVESALTGFTDLSSFTANTSASLADGLDNSICWYRLGFKAGAFTSGTATVNISFSGGGGAGVARITSLNSNINANVEILDTKQFYGITSANNWYLSEWSDDSGWPTSVAIHEGRLWFAGNSKIWGSVSDAYLSFNFDQVGDAGPIDRSIGSGPVANISWLLSLNRLLLGADTSIVTARSNSFDEPLTPTVFNLKTSSTNGASSMRALKIDNRGIFVQQSGQRIYDVAFNIQTSDYQPTDLTRLNPEICGNGIVDLAIQRQLDTRIHFVRSDGQIACLVYDKDDQVEAWWRIVTDGLIENVVVLPGVKEDKVYFVINRSIGGVSKRYIERWARVDECQGGLINKLADCHSLYSGVATTTLIGLDYLEGKTVVIWGNGKDLGSVIVAGGQVSGLSEAVTSAVVGLGYSAQFKSAKLAYAATEGSAINQVKRVGHIGLLLSNTHYQGVKYGPSFDLLDDLPLVEDGATIGADTIWGAYDQQQFEFSGEYNTDSRICVTATAPRPATVLGITLELSTSG